MHIFRKNNKCYISLSDFDNQAIDVSNISLLELNSKYEIFKS